MYKRFHKWLKTEAKDIFGFEKHITQKQQSQDENPIQPIEIPVVIEYLGQLSLPTKNPITRWENECQWGENTGAVKVSFSPFGSFKAVIHRKTVDLQGNPAWICKECISLVDLKESEQSLTQILFDAVEKVDKMPLDTATDNFVEFENLILRVASRVKRECPAVFLYEGVKKMNESNYLIYFSARGAGTGRLGHAGRDTRLEEFIIDLSYNKKRGLIKCFGHDVTSPIRAHEWNARPSEWEEYFCPTQESDVIVGNIATFLSTY